MIVSAGRNQAYCTCISIIFPYNALQSCNCVMEMKKPQKEMIITANNAAHYCDKWGLEGRHFRGGCKLYLTSPAGLGIKLIGLKSRPGQHRGP